MDTSEQQLNNIGIGIGIYIYIGICIGIYVYCFYGQILVMDFLHCAFYMSIYLCLENLS